MDLSEFKKYEHLEELINSTKKKGWDDKRWLEEYRCKFNDPTKGSGYISIRCYLGKTGRAYIGLIQKHLKKGECFYINPKKVFCANNCERCEIHIINLDRYRKALELLIKYGHPQSKEDKFRNFVLIDLDQVLEQKQPPSKEKRKIFIYSVEDLKHLRDKT